MDFDELGAGSGLPPWSWQEWKLFLEHSVAVSNDSIHVIAAVALQLLFALLFKRPLSSLLPWLAVLALALANEASDFWADLWPKPAMQYGESAKDLVLTMALPTLLLLSTRYLPQLYGRALERAAERPAETEEDSTSRPL